MNVATSGGTAVAGVNYTSVNTTLSFPAGQNSETVTIPILNAGRDSRLDGQCDLEQPGQRGCSSRARLRTRSRFTDRRRHKPAALALVAER